MADEGPIYKAASPKTSLVLTPRHGFCKKWASALPGCQLARRGDRTDRADHLKLGHSHGLLWGGVTNSKIDGSVPPAEGDSYLWLGSSCGRYRNQRR